MPIKHWTNRYQRRDKFTPEQLARRRRQDRERNLSGRRKRERAQREKDVLITEHNIDKIMVEPEPKSQAERIIAKFGGARCLMKAINALGDVSITAASVFKWTYGPERGGTGGVIPTRMVQTVMRAARREGIYLDESDFYPGKK